MLNHIVIMGRLTRDPELRRTQKGTAVTTITLAVDRSYQPKDAQEKQTDFFDVVVWGATAEFAAKYFLKGRMAIAEGSMQSRKWQDRDGNNRTSWEVLAHSLYFGDSKRAEPAGAAGAPGDTPADGSAAAGSARGDYAEIAEDGDLPF